ncbi:hypothetical protein Tco_1295607, partial [Tanacetum coccineum]
VLTKLYLKLAEKLHRLVVQLVADGSDVGYVKITYTSSRATDDIDTPLVRSMVASSIRNKERDTLGWSSEKPLEIRIRIANVKSRFATAVSEFGDIKLQGRVKDGVPHLTKVGAFEVDVSLEGNILLCRQLDQANTISRVRSILNILGEENVNMNSMSVGRPAPSKQVVMVIGINEKPSEEALKKIDEIHAVEEFVFLAFYENLVWISGGVVSLLSSPLSEIIPSRRAKQADKNSNIPASVLICAFKNSTYLYTLDLLLPLTSNGTPLDLSLIKDQETSSNNNMVQTKPIPFTHFSTT